MKFNLVYIFVAIILLDGCKAQEYSQILNPTSISPSHLHTLTNRALEIPTDKTRQTRLLDYLRKTLSKTDDSDLLLTAETYTGMSIEELPTSTRWGLIALELRLRNEPELSRSAFGALRDTAPTPIKRYMAESRQVSTWLLSGKLEKAQKVADVILEESPSNPMVLLYVKAMSGNLQFHTIDNLRGKLGSNASRAMLGWIQNILGGTLIRRENCVEGLKYLRAAASNMSDSNIAHQLLIRNFLLAESIDEAIAQINTALGLYPRDEVINWLAATAYFLKAKINESSTYGRNALEFGYKPEDNPLNFVLLGLTEHNREDGLALINLYFEARNRGLQLQPKIFEMALAQMFISSAKDKKMINEIITATKKTVALFESRPTPRVFLAMLQLRDTKQPEVGVRNILVSKYLITNTNYQWKSSIEKIERQCRANMPSLDFEALEASAKKEANLILAEGAGD